MTQLEISREEVKAVAHPSPWMARPVHRCMQIVCRHYGLTIRELRTPRRFKRIVWPRQVAAWLAFKLCVSYPLIGHHLGGLDHTTIIHARRKIDKRRAADPEFRALTDRLLDEALTLPEPPAEPVAIAEPPQPPPAPEPPPEPARADLWASEPNWYCEAGKMGRAYLEKQNDSFCAAMRAAHGDNPYPDDRRAGR